jgi:hypothetical protein
MVLSLLWEALKDILVIFVFHIRLTFGRLQQGGKFVYFWILLKFYNEGPRTLKEFFIVFKVANVNFTSTRPTHKELNHIFCHTTHV